jgi:hypothetical protein
MVLHAMHNFRDDICLSRDAVDQHLELTAALSYATPAVAVSIIPMIIFINVLLSPSSELEAAVAGCMSP